MLERTTCRLAQLEACTHAEARERQRVGTNFGFVVFADSGGVSSSSGSVYRVGVGAGMRYYTSIGPIRFDVAVPAQKRPNDDNFEIYIGLGQAF